MKGQPLSHNPSSATNRTIESVDELGTDLAGRYKFTASSGATIDPAVADADLVAIERDGYDVILEGLLSATACEEIKAAVSPLLNKTGRNTFEGLRSPSSKSSTSTPVSRPSCYTTTTACTSSPGLDHLGRYRDTLVPDGDTWLIKHRKVSTDWAAPNSAMARPSL